MASRLFFIVIYSSVNDDDNNNNDKDINLPLRDLNHRTREYQSNSITTVPQKVYLLWYSGHGVGLVFPGSGIQIPEGEVNVFIIITGVVACL